MIILKNLLSGAGAEPICSEISEESRNYLTNHISSIDQVGGADLTKTEDQKQKMEFMYCIPDLELFIDKTIKKCLLEYDLDANDTEAVLDDMEKAWPNSPRDGEKDVTKDCNDNTEVGGNNRQTSAFNLNVEARLLNGTSDKSLSSRNGLKEFGVKRKLGESSMGSENVSRKEAGPRDSPSNSKKGAELPGEDGNRSGSSTPDLGEGGSQVRRHSKLKSRLQQRYFESNQTADHGSEQTTSSSRPDPGHHDPWGAGGQPSSNLDLLASAANIHTESSRRREEERQAAARRLQEGAARTGQEVDSGRGQSAHGDMRTPVNNLMDTSTHSGQVVSTAALSHTHTHVPQLVRLVPATASSPLLLASLAGLSSSSTPLLSTASSLQHSSSNNSAISGSPINSGPRVSGIDTCHSSSMSAIHSNARPSSTSLSPGKEGVSFVSRDRAQVLLQHYQEGYHALIPRETVVVRRKLPKQMEEYNDGHRVTTPTGSAWNGVGGRTTTETYHRTSSPSAHGHTAHLVQRRSEGYREPLHHYGSRIATIIAEELQKDNDNQQDTPSSRNIPSLDRIIPPEMKPSASQEPRRSKPLQTGSLRHAAHPSPFTSHPSMQAHRGRNHHSMGLRESPPAHVRHAPHLLPAHATLDSAHLGSPQQSSHLAHCPADRYSRGSPYTTTTPYTITDDQPEDLSTKPRVKTSEEMMEQGALYFTSTNPDSPVTEKGGRGGYFSSPSSPLSMAAVSSRPAESPVMRKSLSPSNSSDKECDYNCGSDAAGHPLKVSGKWERKGQVHGLDILPSGAKDSKVLVERRRMEALKRWSEARGEEVSKRRSLE